MKIKFSLGIAFLAAGSLVAAPLAQTTPVHAKPDRSAPAIAVLASGTEPELAPLPSDPVPAGWEAVVVSSQKDAYVASKDIAKSLDVKVGATLRSGPKADAAVVGTMEPGDYAEIVTVRGKWHQVRVTKKTVGYIQTGVSSASSMAVTSAPPSSAVPSPAPAAPAAAPASPTASTFGGAGRPVETVNLGDNAALPRLFQGTFASSRRPLMPRRPYDFQLNDANGERYAYLDTSKLLLTEQIDRYIDRTVVVYGTAKPVPNTRDIVIEVESLQLR